MKRFWVGWYMRYIDDDDEVMSTWPAGMFNTACTGQTCEEVERCTYVSTVEAETEAAARKLVESCYGKFAIELEWRFFREIPIDGPRLRGWLPVTE